MKRCTKCDLKKELVYFYKSNKTLDGYHNSCKECWKVRRHERYFENRDKVRKQCRIYYILHSDHLKAKSKRQKKTIGQLHMYRAKNPEKYKARYVVSNSLKRGIITKKDKCEICNSKQKLQAHHRDYTKPLEVLWVCRNCHAKIHIRDI
jgi:hypothetical protein